MGELSFFVDMCRSLFEMLYTIDIWQSYDLNFWCTLMMNTPTQNPQIPYVNICWAVALWQKGKYADCGFKYVCSKAQVKKNKAAPANFVKWSTVAQRGSAKSCCKVKCWLLMHVVNLP